MGHFPAYGLHARSPEIEFVISRRQPTPVAQPSSFVIDLAEYLACNNCWE
jgi:hypothetical protein